MELTSALVASIDVPSRTLGRFEPSTLDARCAGRAVTVRGAGGDNRAVYRGLATAQAGDVLVIALGGSAAAGHWGGLLTRAARNAGLAGVVVDGAVRDRVELAALGLPVFFRGLCPRKATKADPGEVGGTISVGEGSVAAGDHGVAGAAGVVAVAAGYHVSADADGVVAFAAGDLLAVLDATRAIATAEAAIEARLARGASVAEAFGLVR
jgi:4-hydroxy-4-methyl-2-oxoglutarate aldolase